MADVQGREEAVMQQHATVAMYFRRHPELARLHRHLCALRQGDPLRRLRSA
jgi:hypothetical protein